MLQKYDTNNNNETIILGERYTKNEEMCRTIPHFLLIYLFF
jgi:hypothetical protein